MTQTQAFSEKEMNVLVELARPFFYSKRNNMVYSVQHGQNERYDVYDRGAFTGEQPRGIEYQTVLPNSVTYKKPEHISQDEVNYLIRAFGFLHVFKMFQTKENEPFLQQEQRKKDLLEQFYPTSRINISELNQAIKDDYLRLTRDNQKLPDDISKLRDIQKDFDEFILMCFLMIGFFELNTMGYYEEFGTEIATLMNTQNEFFQKIKFAIEKRQQCLQKIRDELAINPFRRGGRKKTHRRSRRRSTRKRARARRH